MSESRPVDEELSSTSFSPEDVLSIENIVPIVGIGASAGGLDAFRQLLANLPESTGMAFVLVQHLDPIHESHLSEILSRMTKMPVREAESGLEVLPNHIYVIPPGMTLTLSHGALQLAPRTEKRGLHLPIDIFFRSLAEHNRGKAIGVILSGTGSDGALGLEEIKSSGGITFAQDPLSATHDGMPKSAIDEGLADFILPPAGIANELARIGGQDNPFLNPDDVEKDSDREGFSALLGLLKTKMNVDFTQYRDSTLKRRIQRRMTLRHLHTVAEYVQLLGADSVEIEALYQDILINVTRFFRDPEVFESLKTAVFPEILKGKSPDAPIRIWVTGCSSGQEAYTVAMVLLEFLADLPRPPTIQIFASDLKEASALAKARLGCYPENIEADVSPERLQKFFTKEDKGYQIRKSVRDLCVFAKHDLIADPPFSHVDLVTCRNVLIYMSSDLQRRIMPIFHYALNQEGFLLLGSSETVGRDSDLFTIVDRSHRIYRRNSAASRPPHFLLKQNASIAVPPTFQHGLVPVTQADFRREADRILLNRFPPACVLVNADLDILQFRGRTRPYLEPAQGAASFNLLKMANDSLFLELRAAVQDAQSRKTVIEKMDVRVRNEGEIKTIRLEVIPVTVPISKETCFLILFHEDSPTKPSVPGSMAVAGATGGPVGPGSEDAHAANAASRDEAYSLLNEKA
ncbi:MAG: ATPase, partial [Fibrobacteres bacterium]|nr:ATPase [Fibrobacterota bacterium]